MAYRGRFRPLLITGVALFFSSTALGSVHKVVEGQTLGTIAKHYHVTIAELREANHLVPGQVLPIGMQLTIPGAGGHDEGADPHAQRKPAPQDRTRPAVRAAKRGSVRLALGPETWEGRVTDGHGKPTPSALSAFSHLMRFAPTGKPTRIEPRLVALVGQVSDHFGGRTLRVVSGFRPVSPTQYTPHSRHNAGAALDFHIDGVSNEELAAFCKTFRNVGVGTYPNSSFVHLDVRPVSATWVDYAGPGQRPLYKRPGDSSKDADEATEDVVGGDEPGK